MVFNHMPMVTTMMTATTTTTMTEPQFIYKTQTVAEEEIVRLLAFHHSYLSPPDTGTHADALSVHTEGSHAECTSPETIASALATCRLEEKDPVLYA